MYIAFFDSDKNNTVKIRDWLIRYTITNNTELNVLWFDNTTAEKVSRYVSAVSIAFISLDCSESLEIGLKISQINPDCFICYYKSEKCDLIPVLNSRPYDFFIYDQNENSFIKLLGEAINSYKKSKNAFCYETKRGLWCYPVRNILYLQSDMKYVNIITLKGENGSVYAKLTEIEEEIYEQGNSNCFIRVHKSYIVNAFHIKSINKTNHTVQLFSGEEIPISDAYYKDAINKLKVFYNGIQADK